MSCLVTIVLHTINHVIRVLNYFRVPCVHGSAAAPTMVLVAAAFHDLGIWSTRTFDYLGPSVGLAREHLASANLQHLIPEVEAIIVWHHKLSRYRGEFASTVETFRRADLVDLSLGMIRFGVSAPSCSRGQRVASQRGLSPPSGGTHRTAVASQSLTPAADGALDQGSARLARPNNALKRTRPLPGSP